MENSKKYINDNIIIYKRYCESIIEYENYINQIYNNLNENDEEHKGYLIDSKEFENLKQDIYLDIHKIFNAEYKEQIRIRLSSLISENKSIELKKFEQEEIKSFIEFSNKLQNNNEFILINTELWKTICKKEKENEEPLIYYINKSELFFILKDNNIIHFRHNKNILNKQSFIIQNIISNNNKDITKPFHNIDNNVDVDNKTDSKNNINNNENPSNNINKISDINDIDKKLENIINVIEEFYLFQKNISLKYNNSTNEYKDSGYLIDKKLIDKWKTNINYEIIKNNYLNNYFKKNKNLSKEEKDEIIKYIKSQNIENYINNLGEIKCLELKTKNEFIDCISKNSFVLINKKIYCSINGKKEIEEKEIKYKIKDFKIIFNTVDSDFDCYSSSNIISSSFNLNLYILIKIFYLQKDIQEKKNSPNVLINNYYMIDKDFIKKYKEYFSYDKLNDFLKNIQNDQLDIDIFLNDEDKIFEIIEKLPKEYIKSTFNKFESNLFKIEDDKKFLTKEIILSEGKTLKYTNNVEIINFHVLKILNRIINNTRNISYPGRFYFINNKIMIIFKAPKSDLLCAEIGYLNDLNEYIVEYLIEITDNTIGKKEISKYDNLIQNINSNNFLNQIYNDNDFSYQLATNIIFNFYKISNNYNDINNNNINNIGLLNNHTQFLLNQNYLNKPVENINDKLKNYLQLVIIFMQTDINIKSKIKNKDNKDEECFLINKEWINEFKFIFNYDGIKNEIQENINENINDFIDTILETLSKENKEKINSVKEDEIYNKLNNNDLYKIEEYNPNNISLS